MIKDTSKISMYRHPASIVMMPCRYSYPITKRELVPPGSMICLKEGECTCVKYGQTLPMDKDPNIDEEDDTARLLENKNG